MNRSRIFGVGISSMFALSLAGCTGGSSGAQGLGGSAALISQSAFASLTGVYVTPSSLVFGAESGGADPAQQSFMLVNGSRRALSWTASENASWLSLEPASGTLAPDSRIKIVVDASVAGLAPGLMNEFITISDGGAHTTTLPVSLEITPSGASTIAATIAPSRVTGVAPLSVFFDASATSAPGIARPFHEIEYSWDFGDPLSGNWSTNSLPRNSARGPVAGHVFEAPGEYTVTVLARDAQGQTGSAQVEIAVTDPNVVYSGNKTICVSKAGNFAGAPAGALHVTTSNLDQAMGHVGTGKRVLFRRGESWTGDGAWINAPGPVTVGAFGAGAKPSFSMTGESTFLKLSGADQNTNDWRVMDLDVSGANATGFGLEGTVKWLLLLRVDMHDLAWGFTAPVSVLNYYNNQGFPQEIHHDLALVDSSIVGSGIYGAFLDSEKLMLLGNDCDGVKDEHVLRLSYLRTGVIASNRIANGSLQKHALKMHAPSWTGSGLTSGKYTERVVISDNRIEAGASQWAVVPGPQNSAEDERLRDILIERNHFVAGPTTTILLRMSGEDTTIRNNIFDHTGGPWTGIWVSKRGSEPSPDRCHLVNNSFYRADAGGGFVGIHIAGDAKNSVVKNNLASAPLASSPKTLLENESASTVSSDNLLTNAPGWAAASPKTPSDFQITANSPAVDAGAVFPTALGSYLLFGSPFDGNDDGSVLPDLGAFEYKP